MMSKGKANRFGRIEFGAHFSIKIQIHKKKNL